MALPLTGLSVTGKFVNRDTEMRQIEHSLLSSNAQDGRRVHVLLGLGGIGKTQLAIAYAWKHQQRYTAVLWLNANRRDTLVQSLAEYADYEEIGGTRDSTINVVEHGYELSEKTKAVLRWLALDGNCRWLLIFDNLDRVYDIESFLPATNHGSVLITTQNPHLEQYWSTTKMTSVDQEQGRQILKNIIQDLPTRGNRVPGVSCS